MDDGHPTGTTTSQNITRPGIPIRSTGPHQTNGGERLIRELL